MSSGGTAFFTICARNYLAFGSLLGESVLAQHPDANFTIWVLDPGELPELPAGVVARPISEAVDEAEWTGLAFYYDLLELATAVKPRCFERMFAEGAARVIYLDPDIRVFRPLAEVARLLDEGAAGVVTPHTMAPLPADDALPDDLVLLQAGIYNLGFLALAAGSDAERLLDWWGGWLRTHCFTDKNTGTFTDQKWMNFAPLFWPDIAILRDTAYNVAYWNLPQRQLDLIDGEWRVDGRPLVFFHFSGFDPERPRLLSKHQTRIDVRAGAPLARILEDYAESVLARRHAELCRLRPERVTFDNGLRADGIARHVFRRSREEGLAFAEPLATGVGSFFAWMSSPVVRDLHNGASPPLTRYLMMLYELRPDVRQAYPDVYGADREAFLAWAARQAVPEMGADPELLDRQLPTGEAVRREPEPETSAAPAVNLVGYLRAALGIGEAARGYLAALRAVGVPVHPIDCTDLCASPAVYDAPTTDVPAGTRAGINLIHVNADQLLAFRDRVGPEFFRGRYNIGIWAWETLRFPEEWIDRFDLLDEIWTGSAFIADAIGRVSPRPVVRVPHVVTVPDIVADRARFGLAADETLFLFTFDFHSTTTRKNPEATLAAFRTAFQPDEPVRLVLKSINGCNHPRALADLREAARGLRVTVIDEALDDHDRFCLLRSTDCFVSLHRAEGFGLGLAEAMAYGKPVIATGWSGNMEFMTPTNSFPVDYELRPLAQDDPPYVAGSVWAEASVDHAARLMRGVVDDPGHAAAVGARARRHIREAHSPEIIGCLIEERLERIRGKNGVPAESKPPAEPLPDLGLRSRSLAYRSARAVFRSTLRVVPDRYHTRLHRLSARARRLF